MEHKYRNSGRPVFFKALGAEVKADFPSRKVSGYLAAFGNIDLDGDILVKGCFAKSLQEHGPGSPSPQKIAYLYQHEIDEPLGRFTVLTEDDKGLYFEAEIDATQCGDDTLTQYLSGTLNQHSIGFKYIWDKLDFDDTKNAFIVKEVQLFEGSVVTIGSNENTPFTGFKSLQLESERVKMLAEVEKILRSMPAEKAYPLRKIITKYISLADQEPVKPPLPVEPQTVDFVKIIQSLKTH